MKSLFKFFLIAPTAEAPVQHRSDLKGVRKKIQQIMELNMSIHFIDCHLIVESDFFGFHQLIGAKQKNQ